MVEDWPGREASLDNAQAYNPRRRYPIFARLALYIRERYRPIHWLGVGLFAACAWLVSAYVIGGNLTLMASDWLGLAALWLIVLRLRILDDIEDAVEDRQGKPARPIPQGLVTINEMKRLAVIIILVEAGLNLLVPVGVLLTYVAVLGYTLLMYHGFSAIAWISSHRLINSVLHLAILPLVALYVYEVYAIPRGQDYRPEFGVYASAVFLVGFLWNVRRERRRTGIEVAL
jgi:hypothetical protein